jgi:hypothetical protein
MINYWSGDELINLNAMRVRSVKSPNVVAIAALIFCSIPVCSQGLAMVTGFSDFVFDSKTVRSEENIPDCTEPDAVFIVRTGSNEVRVEWADVPAKYDSIRYQVRYRSVKERESFSKWTTNWVFDGNSIFITDLEESTQYEFEIRKICDNYGKEYTLHSDWVKIVHYMRGSGLQDTLCDLFSGFEFQWNAFGTFTIYFPQAVTTRLKGLGFNFIVKYKDCITGTWYCDIVYPDEQFTSQDYTIYSSNRRNSLTQVCDIIVSLTSANPFFGKTHPGGINGWSLSGDGTEEILCTWLIVHEDDGSSTNVDCTGAYSEPPTPGTTIFQGAFSAGDIIHAAGFDVEIVAVNGNSMPAIGKVTLPFQNKVIIIDLNGVSFNTDSTLFSGTIELRPAQGFNMPVNSLVTAGEQCVPPPDQPGWNPDGVHEETGEIWDPNGFGQDGQYIKQPPYEGYELGDPYDPNYDPCGFDANGIHKQTLTMYNPYGCSQNNLDDEDNPCELNCVPYYWLNPSNTPTVAGNDFCNELRDSLPDLINEAIDSLIAEHINLRDEKRGLCQGVANEMRTIVTQENITDTTFIFGENSEYINEGLSQAFASPPESVADFYASRNEAIVDLENKHVALYACDLELQSILDLLQALGDLDSGQGIEDLEAFIANAIKALTESQVAQYQDPTALLDALKAMILQYLNDPVAGQGSTGWIEIPKPGIDQLPSHFNQSAIRSRRELYSYARFASLETRSMNLMAGGGSNDGNVLPLDISKVIGGESFTIVITRVAFNPNYAELDAYIKMRLPNSAEEVIFQGTNLRFSPTGLQLGKLVLGSEVTALKINNVAQLVLEPTTTYVTWDCTGFESLQVDGHIEFCPNYLLPIDAQGNPISDPDTADLVKAHFTTNVSKLDGIYASITMDDFAIKGAEHVTWKVVGATLDLSDAISPDFVFPPGYNSPFGQDLNQSGDESPTGAWRGFHLDTLVATITALSDNQNEEITIGVNDLIIDDRGVSGVFEVGYELLSLDEGNMAGWAYSIDRLRFHVVTNQLIGGGFGGLIHIPLIKQDASTTDIVADDCLNYYAMLLRGGDFQFSVSPKSSMTAPAWLAEIEFDSTSSITVGKINGQFEVGAILDGRVSFQSNVFNSQELLTFQNLEIRNTEPYFKPGKWTLPFDTIGISYSGFELSIFDVQSRKSNGNSGKLAFGAMVGINSDFNVSAAAGIVLNFRINTDTIDSRQKWEYKSLNLERISIEADIKGTYIAGQLYFFNEENNPAYYDDYGEGFQANVECIFKGMDKNLVERAIKKAIDEVLPEQDTIAPDFFGIAASGIFGKKDGFEYFNVDVLAQFSPGIPIVAPLTINGIGGGLSYHMARDSFLNQLPDPSSFLADAGSLEIGESMTGIHYLPDNSVGIGVKLLIAGSIKDESICSVNAGFEIAFNNSNSPSQSVIRQIGMWGNAVFMDDLSFSSIISWPPGILGDALDKFGISADVLDELPIPSLNSEISAYFDLDYNLNESVLNGHFAVILEAGTQNVPILYGRALAELHIGSSEWYFNLGRLRDDPKGRAELTLDLAIAKATVQSYLNIGTGIPPIPDPPRQIKELFGNISSPDASLGWGTGFAFGVFADVGIDIDLFIAQLELNAGFGFDLAIKKYQNAICHNTGDEIGINGWYASGQAYLYLSGGVKLLGADLLNITSGVLLQAGFPNPSWVDGHLAVKYKILFLKGEARAHIKFGERCDLVGDGSTLPEVISYVLPVSGSTKIDPYSGIDVYFNLPMSQSFKLTSNGVTSTFETEVDSIALTTSSGFEIPVSETYSADGFHLHVVPEYTMPIDDTLTFFIRTVLRKDNIAQNDLSSLEKTIGFWTSEGEVSIPETNIIATYPVAGMSNFYRKEYSKEKGYINLVKNQFEFLEPPADKEFLIKLKSTSGLVYSGPIEYSIADKTIEFPLSAQMMTPGDLYRLQLVLADIPGNSSSNNTPQLVLADDQLVEYDPIWEIVFRVSMYDEFADKINALLTSFPTQVQAANDFRYECVSVPINLDEPFDEIETSVIRSTEDGTFDREQKEDLMQISLDLSRLKFGESSSVSITWDSLFKEFAELYLEPFATWSELSGEFAGLEPLQQSVGIGSSCESWYEDILARYIQLGDFEAQSNGLSLSWDFGEGDPLMGGTDISEGQQLRIFSFSMIPGTIEKNKWEAYVIYQNAAAQCLGEGGSSPWNFNSGANIEVRTATTPVPGGCNCGDIFPSEFCYLVDDIQFGFVRPYPEPPSAMMTLPITFEYVLPGGREKSVIDTFELNFQN